MESYQVGGIEGHQWSLHRASGTQLAPRIVCECTWTSTAESEPSVLLELKDHLVQISLSSTTTAQVAALNFVQRRRIVRRAAA